MARQEEGFVFRYVWAEELLKLPENLRGKINDAIQRFAIYGEEPEDEYLKYTMYSVIRSQIIRDREKYESTCEERRRAALIRWQTNDASAYDCTQVDANDASAYDCIQVDANDANKINKERKVNKSSKEKESKKKSAPMRFTPPTLEEVREFISTNGYTLVDAETFYNHYTSIGWKVGKNAMKDWHAAVRGWQSRERKNAPAVTEESTAPKRLQLM